MKSVLIVYNLMGPTTIVRGYQFAAAFADDPDFSARYVARTPHWLQWALARAQNRWWATPLVWILKALEPALTRWTENRILKMAPGFDVVLLLCARSWPLHEALWKAGARIVMDFSDAMWLPHFRVGYERLDDMFRCSHAISCENSHLFEYARQRHHNARLTPDAPQIEAFDEIRGDVVKPAEPIIIGWLGGVWAAENLYSIFEPLEALFARHDNIHLRIVGASLQKLPRFEHVRFSCKTGYTNTEMLEEALRMDIGLFPLFRTEDSQARGILKAKIYMSAGAVAVCQDWGEAPALIRHRENGVVANTAEDWLRELEWLIENPLERKAIAARGLETVRLQFSRQTCFERLKAVFESVDPLQGCLEN